MIKTLITEFPLSEVLVERTVTEEKIRKYTYSKEEVDALIADAVKEAVAAVSYTHLTLPTNDQV